MTLVSIMSDLLFYAIVSRIHNNNELFNEEIHNFYWGSAYPNTYMATSTMSECLCVFVSIYSLRL
jgi:hypothetical protein